VNLNFNLTGHVHDLIATASAGGVLAVAMTDYRRGHQDRGRASSPASSFCWAF